MATRVIFPLSLVLLMIVACAETTPTPTPAGTIASPAATPPVIPTARPDLPLAPEIVVPQGFRAYLYVEGLSQPTSMAFGPEGRLYIAEVGGRILVADGGALRRVAAGFPQPLGLAFRGADLYVSWQGGVSILEKVTEGGTPRQRDIITGLPFGRHQNNGLAFGPDGKLYLGVGSTCDVCAEKDPRSATVMRFNPDGSGVEVFARGLRNVYDLTFHPQDGSLWGADNGRDDLGMAVPEELNLIVQGGDYGWPDCYGRGRGSHCEGTIPPVAEMEPRSSADGLAFYTGSHFPAAYRNNLFIAEYGAHARQTGMKLQRAVLSQTGSTYTARLSDFATGFDRPLDVAVAPDGALLVADFGRGKVYAVRWVGP